MSEDFGLAYESIFDGAMYGKGAPVFAVWLYVIAKGYGGTVTLNPGKLAHTLGATLADVEAAIEFHCSPDPKSRTDTDEGRRLRHLGGYSYEVVNHELYKSSRALEAKRAYNRAKKREERDRKRSTIDVPVFDMSTTVAPILDLSKNCLTKSDPLLSLSSSSSDLISPEGVQGEGSSSGVEPEPATRSDSGSPTQTPPPIRAPADFAPSEAQCAELRRLGRDVERVVKRYKRHEFHREYSDWHARFDTWIEDYDDAKPRRAHEEPAPSPRPPASPKGPPRWVDETHVVFVREHGWELAAMARAFTKEHRCPPDCMQVSDARAAFSQWLAAKARDAPPPSNVTSLSDVRKRRTEAS